MVASIRYTFHSPVVKGIIEFSDRLVLHSNLESLTTSGKSSRKENGCKLKCFGTILVQKYDFFLSILHLWVCLPLQLDRPLRLVYAALSSAIYYAVAVMFVSPFYNCVFFSTDSS